MLFATVLYNFAVGLRAFDCLDAGQSTPLYTSLQSASKRPAQSYVETVRSLCLIGPHQSLHAL